MCAVCAAEVNRMRQIHESVYIAPAAVVLGDVELAVAVGSWPGASV